MKRKYYKNIKKYEKQISTKNMRKDMKKKHEQNSFKTI